MNNKEHWLISLDLTKMDNILAEYTSFFTSIISPKTITFLHVIESGPTARDLIEQFPELENKEEFEKLLRSIIHEKIEAHFHESSIATHIVIREGRATEQIIDAVNTLKPDLLVMGKKIGYAGEGVIPKKILKYVPVSILLVPENCRYSLQKILVPVDFSEQSGKGVKTAMQLVENKKGGVTAQHIYRYRAQFFPYVLSDREKQEADREINKKKETFIKKYDISSDINFAITLQNDGSFEDAVYEQAINDQADLIIVSSKAKKLPNLMGHDFTDRLVDYAFGIPLFIQKNPERYQKFLKSLFTS
ncbi:MAG: universal stress protein [Balneolales bacterium]